MASKRLRCKFEKRAFGKKIEVQYIPFIYFNRQFPSLTIQPIFQNEPKRKASLNEEN